MNGTVDTRSTPNPDRLFPGEDRGRLGERSFPPPINRGKAAGKVEIGKQLNQFTRRNITIAIVDDRPVLAGPTTDTDRTWANLHAHALAVAAAGTHPHWWAAVRAGTNGPGLTWDDIPLADDGDSPACACCGQAAWRVDRHLLAWCPNHLEQETAA